MTTLVLKLTPGLAKRLTSAADHLHLTNDETAVEAIRLFTRSVAAYDAPAQTRTTKKAGRRG